LQAQIWVMYALTNLYRTTVPPLSELKKGCVVRLLVEKRPTVAAIDRVQAAADCRQYDTQRNYLNVEVQVDYISKPAAFQLLYFNQQSGQTLEHFKQGDIIKWWHSRTRLGTQYELEYVSSVKATESVEARQTNTQTKSDHDNNSAHTLLGSASQRDSHRFVMPISDD
jgi:hypothetical protein